MSDASDKLWEKALDREVNGLSPQDGLGTVVVSGKAFAHQQEVLKAAHAEGERWQAEQDEMFSKGISDTSQRWADAAELHQLAMNGFKARLASLAQLGTVR
jgi:hypothetical protein